MLDAILNTLIYAVIGCVAIGILGLALEGTYIVIAGAVSRIADRRRRKRTTNDSADLSYIVSNVWALAQQMTTHTVTGVYAEPSENGYRATVYLDDAPSLLALNMTATLQRVLADHPTSNLRYGLVKVVSK